MSEFDIIKETKPNLNPKTLANYKNLYKRLYTLTGDKDVSSLSNDELIKIINKAEVTPAIKSNLLSLVLVIKEGLKLDIDKLKDAITDNHENVKSYTLVKNEKLKETLPSLKQLQDYENILFKTEKWRPYIMNYLMSSLGVRNKDLNIEFGNDKTEIEPDKNYLLLYKDHVTYIRGDYKTKDTYGDKKDFITSKKFLTAVKNVMETENDGRFLLSLGGNKPIAETSLNKFVSKNTLNGIGQSKIYKIMINSKKTDKEEIAATRGTSQQTTSEHYDIDFKNSVGKAKKRAKAKNDEEPVEEEKPKPKPKKKKFKIIVNPKIREYVGGGKHIVEEDF